MLNHHLTDQHQCRAVCWVKCSNSSAAAIWTSSQSLRFQYQHRRPTEVLAGSPEARRSGCFLKVAVASRMMASTLSCPPPALCVVQDIQYVDREGGKATMLFPR